MLNENQLSEKPVLDWLKELGYEYAFGPDIAPDSVAAERETFREVVLVKRLRRVLMKLNPTLNEQAIDEAIRQLVKYEHPNIDVANKEMYRMLTEGVKVEVKGEGERDEGRGKIVKVIDFDNPANNEFMVVNQFAIQGTEYVKRPDVVVFVNGIPIAVFELKSPTSEEGTIKTAYKQLLKDYKENIPDLFKYTQILVVSDLLEARHGTQTSSWEWFSAWKGIESEEDRKQGLSQLETLVKGLFHKSRLLDIIENFIVFETEGDKVSKKMGLYHQYYGVNKAINATLKATAPNGDKKIGVFWHTQGSGKSLSMVFYANKIRKLSQLSNPTFVFLTDRNDLDNQLYKTFVRSGYPYAKQAESIADLKDKLNTPTGDMVFTTIQKFETEIGDKYPLLSDRHNIIIIADEAHRSQYARLAGNVRQALPNASFMGITGTPISLHDRDTRIVFGDYISIYQINQAVEDGATVPIYYEGRLVPLHLTNQFIDEEYDELLAEQEYEVKESLKRKWARLEEAVGADDRITKIADDIVKHFNGRGLEGKAMVVTMSRRIAAKMYGLISKIPGAPEIAVVVSKLEDFKGSIQKETDVKEIERRFKDPADPLKMVIVCDMWLTGFDVPHLHTMYFDKPLKNHGLMQAIARVNRVFKDKNGGLIVDYIGIADNLRKSLSIYSAEIQKEALLPIAEIVAKMMEKYDIVKTYFAGIDFANWKKQSAVDLVLLFTSAFNAVITNPESGRSDDERKKRFLNETTQLFKLFALVSPHKEANDIREDVEFFRGVKKAVSKYTGIRIRDIDEDVDTAVKELISSSIAAEGVIDIFRLQGKGQPDISIFNEKFIEEIKRLKYKNVAIEVLRKLLNDELRVRTRKNEIRYKSLVELLEQIIEQYENNILNSAKGIEKLIELAKEIKKADKTAEELGMSEEELAFYDAIAKGKRHIKSDAELKAFVKDLVRSIRKDLTVDWTNNEIIKARIRSGVKLLLLRNDYPPEETEEVVGSIYSQAYSLYKDYVPVA